MGCRTVSGREAFSRDDERCGVGTEIEEKRAQDEQGELSTVGDNVVTESENWYLLVTV